MSVNGYIIFNTLNTEDIYFGNASVQSVYYGSTLVWEKIRKVLQWDDSAKFICIEYVPSVDTTVSDLTFLVETPTSYGWTWILNEVGLCVARRDNASGTGTQQNFYGVTAYPETVSSLGSPVLLAGRKYYIQFKNFQWEPDDSKVKMPYYQSPLTGNYKEFVINGNVSKSTTYDLNTVPAVGYIHHLGQLNTSTWAFTPSDFYGSNVNVGTLFAWFGGDINTTEFKASPYPSYANHDMRNMRFMITDQWLNDATNDMKRLALIYYLIGQNPGAEFIWGSQYNYSSGISPNGTSMFYDGLWTIYKATGNLSKNHITSMTPITQEPTNKELGDLYYKGVTTAADGWLDKDGNPITQEMVVAWGGGAWEFASNWRYEFDVVSSYTGKTCISTIQDNYAALFNNATLYTGKKYYLSVNGNEV